MKKIGLIVFFFALPMYVIGQAAKRVIPDLSKYKSISSKLNALADVCDSLLLNEKFGETQLIADYGLKIIPQEDYDNLSLFNAYKGGSISSTQKDSAIFYMEQSLLYAKKGKNARRTHRALERLLSWYNYSSGYITQREETAKQIQYIIDTSKSDDVKNDMYNALSGYYGQLGLYETQLKYQLANLELKTKRIKKGTFTAIDSGNYGVALIAIGQTYLIMKQPAKALQYTAPARTYVYGYVRGLIHFYRDMVNANLLLKNTQIANLYYDSLSHLKTEPTYKEVKWYGRIVMDLYFAEYYATTNFPDSALIYTNRAIALSAEYADDFLKPQVMQTVGTVYVLRKEYSSALPFLLKAENSFQDQNRELYNTLLKTIAQCYVGLGQWQKASQYYQKVMPLNDSLHAEGISKSLANAEAKYQNKDKQQQIEIQKSKLNFAQKQKVALLSGIILLIVVALLLFINYRNKKKSADLLDNKNKILGQLNNDLEEANQTKAKLFGIISHDLRSPISQVYQFLKLQQMAPDKLNEEQRNKLSDKIQSATGSLLETMEDLLLWSKTQMNQFNADMQPVALDEMVGECLQLMQLNIEAKNLKVYNQLQEEVIVKSDPYFLQTILRNLLQNALKAAPQNGYLKIDFINQQLSIENDGGHFSQAQYEQVLASKNDANSLSGLGLRLVDELSGKINVTISFAAAAVAITKVSLSFSASSK